MTYPFGLKNGGVICWLNSLLQALISSETFRKSIKESSDESVTIQQLRTFIQLFEDKEDISLSSTLILKALVSDLAKRKHKIDMGFGQQSSSEGLVLILDVISNTTHHCFDHIYEDSIECIQTGDTVSKIRSTNNIFYIFDEETLLEKGLRNFLLSHSTDLDSGFIPDDYKKEHQPDYTYRRHYTLRRMPNVVVIALNRYMTNGKQSKERNPEIKLPDTFTMPHVRKGEIVYKKIAEIDHIGRSTLGGHYVARAKRDDNSYLFNDEHVQLHRLETCPTTYLTFYEC